MNHEKEHLISVCCHTSTVFILMNVHCNIHTCVCEITIQSNSEPHNMSAGADYQIKHSRLHFKQCADPMEKEFYNLDFLNRKRFEINKHMYAEILHCAEIDLSNHGKSVF